MPILRRGHPPSVRNDQYIAPILCAETEGIEMKGASMCRLGEKRIVRGQAP